jgi:hypothetical protein
MICVYFKKAFENAMVPAGKQKPEKYHNLVAAQRWTKYFVIPVSKHISLQKSEG